jgi:predicted RNase H-like nuclease (RuvC/YqgF family)
MDKTKLIFTAVIIIMCSSIVTAQSVVKKSRIAKANKVYVLQKQLKHVENRIVVTEKTLADLKEKKYQLHKSVKEKAKIEIETMEKSISDLKEKKSKIKLDEEKKLKKAKEYKVKRRLDSIDRSISDLNREIDELRKITN